MGRPLDKDIIIKILERWQKAFKENSHYVSASDLSLVIKDVRELPTIQSVATDINVGDTISRQWLMECVNEGWIKFDTEKDENRFIHLVRDMAPSAQPEPQWIPVSERLPEKGGEYLVSVHHTIGAISVFHPEKDTYVDDVAIMKYYGKFPSTVRAWMPLPEPYNPNK